MLKYDYWALPLHHYVGESQFKGQNSVEICDPWSTRAHVGYIFYETTKVSANIPLRVLVPNLTKTHLKSIAALHNRRGRAGLGKRSQGHHLSRWLPSSTLRGDHEIMVLLMAGFFHLLLFPFLPCLYSPFDDSHLIPRHPFTALSIASSSTSSLLTSTTNCVNLWCRTPPGSFFIQIVTEAFNAILLPGSRHHYSHHRVFWVPGSGGSESSPFGAPPNVRSSARYGGAACAQSAGSANSKPLLIHIIKEKIQVNVYKTHMVPARPSPN
ncbi:hypothetical protein B0H11DRAFT_1916472 [Mycena galericulata]|nr:hypothetical protein B0H11DRAFT_1916472 [Mycena galericulata]